jgi:hypothetical protein
MLGNADRLLLQAKVLCNDYQQKRDSRDRGAPKAATRTTRKLIKKL